MQCTASSAVWQRSSAKRTRSIPSRPVLFTFSFVKTASLPIVRPYSFVPISPPQIQDGLYRKRAYVSSTCSTVMYVHVTLLLGGCFFLGMWVNKSGSFGWRSLFFANRTEPSLVALPSATNVSHIAFPPSLHLTLKMEMFQIVDCVLHRHGDAQLQHIFIDVEMDVVVIGPGPFFFVVNAEKGEHAREMLLIDGERFGSHPCRMLGQRFTADCLYDRFFRDVRACFVVVNDAVVCFRFDVVCKRAIVCTARFRQHSSEMTLNFFSLFHMQIAERSGKPQCFWNDVGGFPGMDRSDGKRRRF